MLFTFAGQVFTADPSGALHWAAADTLIVADLHIEKGSAFAARGSLLPPYDSAATLERLARVAAHYQPRRILALGDNAHDAGGWQRLAPALRGQLAALADRYRIDFLFGNHDRLQPPPVGNVSADLIESGIRFTHEPARAAGVAVMAGHLHPIACLPTAGGNHRVRCFYRGAHLLILPAFGAYTGGLDVHDPAFAPLLDDGADLLLCGRDMHRLPLAAYLQTRDARRAHPSEKHQRRGAQ